MLDAVLQWYDIYVSSTETFDPANATLQQADVALIFPRVLKSFSDYTGAIYDDVYDAGWSGYRVSMPKEDLTNPFSGYLAGGNGYLTCMSDRDNIDKFIPYAPFILPFAWETTFFWIFRRKSDGYYISMATNGILFAGCNFYDDQNTLLYGSTSGNFRAGTYFQRGPSIVSPATFYPCFQTWGFIGYDDEEEIPATAKAIKIAVELYNRDNAYFNIQCDSQGELVDTQQLTQWFFHVGNEGSLTDKTEVYWDPPMAGESTVVETEGFSQVDLSVFPQYTFTQADLYDPDGILIDTFTTTSFRVQRSKSGVYIVKAYATIEGQDPYSPDIPIPSLPSDIIAPDFPYSSIEKYATMGLYKIFTPSDQQFRNFTGYLYSSTFADALKNLWNRIVPVDDLIVSVKVLPCKPAVAGSAAPKVGWVSFGIGTEMDYTEEQYVTVDLGTLRLDPAWRSYLDYAPYTSVGIYLPFIGERHLDTSDVMGSAISLHYVIDTLSGDCTAYIDIDGSIHYQFVGNCGYQIPISSADVSSMMMAPLKAIGKAAGIAATGLAVSTGSPVAAAVGAALQGTAEENEDGSVNVSSNLPGPVESTSKPATGMIDSLAANSGFMTVITPYLFIERVLPAIPEDFGHYYGYVSNKKRPLATQHGYTKVAEIDLENICATQAEKAEIVKMLKGGIVI